MGIFFFGTPRAPRMKKLNGKALIYPFLPVNLLLSKVWGGQLTCVPRVGLSSTPSVNGKPFTMPCFGLYQLPSDGCNSFASTGVMILWEYAVLRAHGPLGLVGLPFLTAGILFSFVFVFDPNNVVEAFDILLYPESLCVQRPERTLMSAQSLYWLQVSELFPHL